MPTCPSCSSGNCIVRISDSHIRPHQHHHPHYHRPHTTHGSSGDIITPLIVLGAVVVGGISLYLWNEHKKKQEESQKFHYKNWKCLDCKHEFSDWDAEKVTIDWKIKNNSSQKLHLEFYSQDRRRYVWPGDNKVYVLESGSIHTYSLRGLKEEKVCYGAWNPGTSGYWGCGKNNKHGCTGCCYTLNSDMNGEHNLID